MVQKVPLRNVQKRRESSVQICRQKRMCTFHSETKVLETNKQVIFAFIFVFIVYRTVSYVFERLFRSSGTGLNVV